MRTGFICSAEHNLAVRCRESHTEVIARFDLETNKAIVLRLVEVFTRSYVPTRGTRSRENVRIVPGVPVASAKFFRPAYFGHLIPCRTCGSRQPSGSVLKPVLSIFSDLILDSSVDPRDSRSVVRSMSMNASSSGQVMLFRWFRTSLVSLARPSEGTDGFWRSIATSRLPLGPLQTDITSGARFRQACAPAAGSLNYELYGQRSLIN